MGIILEEEQKGFTIIEVMLFLALTGFLLAGILVGAGSSIANQRYKDAVQDAADVLRKAYSFVADTQIGLRDDGKDGENACDSLVSSVASSIKGEAGRGRTSCSVYGAVVTIKTDKESALTEIQTTTLLGRDLYDVTLQKDTEKIDCTNDENKDKLYCVVSNPSSSDIELLRALEANNLVRHSKTNHTEVAGNSATQKIKWGAFFREPLKGVDDGRNEGDALNITLLIYRSPRDGSIRTLVKDDIIRVKGGTEAVDYRNLPQSADPGDYGVNQYFKLNADGSYDKFSAKDVFICIDSGGAESYADHARMIRIMKNAHSQSGIKLEDLDADVQDPANPTERVLCDKN